MTGIITFIDPYKEGQDYEGLKPPKITLKNLWNDIRWYYFLYSQEGLSRRIKIGFLILRILQRVSYNYGWNRRIKTRNNKRMQIEKLKSP